MINVESGITSSNLVVNAEVMNVFNKGTANNTTINNGAFILVFYGGTANDTVVNNGGEFDLESSGTANRTTVNAGGFFDAGGNITGTIVNGGLLISSGGTAVDTTINPGGSFTIEPWGIATGIVENGGYVSVGNGATATFVPNLFTGIKLESTSSATVHSGTTANKVTVNNGGHLEVYSGGTAIGTTVNEGGTLNVSSRGMLTGQMTFANGASVSVNKDSELNFDISNITAGALARVNNLSIMEGTPLYTLTVSASQAEGQYKLAGGAEGFDKTITVYDTSGSKLGTLTVDGSALVIGLDKYTLALSGSDLIFTYETIPVPDTVKPTVSNITATPATPTNGSVTVTASFADDKELASSLYRIGESDSWTDYVDGVTVNENTTVYFKAVDAAGNETVANCKITNIDKVPPATPTASANITGPTNQNVNVSAVFSTDSVRKEYSLDGKNWETYSKAVTFLENGIAYFRGTDAAGNVSDVTTYQVTNIDRIPPATPTASADITKPTMQSVNVAATFSEDSVKQEYSLNGTTWKTYSNPIPFTKNGTVYFRGTDEAGNVSEITTYDVTNIRTGAVDPADDGWNDYLIDKKNQDKPLNDKVYNLAPQTVTAKTKEILLDESGSVLSGDMHNFVGRSEFETPDPADFSKIRLNSAAKLSFMISATASATFKVWSLVEGTDKKGGKTYTMKQLQSVGVKNGTVETWKKPLLLEAGDYYVSMEASNPKKAGEIYYSVLLDPAPENTEFFTKGNNSDDWTDMAEKGAAGHFGKLGTLSKDGVTVVSGEWVGYGDAADYRQFTLSNAATLSFSVDADGPAKFTIWQLNSKTDKKDVTTYSLKSIQSTSIKAPDHIATTKPLLLDAGTYYFSLESTDASKGGSTNYSVALSGCTFYTKGNNSDDWTDMKKNGDAGMVGNAGAIGTSNKKVLSDWTGTGDAVDYKRFTLNSAANLSFKIDASDAAKFTIWQLNSKTDRKDVTTYSLKSLQATTLKKQNDAEFSATTKPLLLDAGTYYFSVESTNARKGGHADYTVSTGDCTFFTKGNNSDDWNNMKEFGDAGTVGSVGTISGVKSNILKDWVGYGDAVDYKKFELNTDALLKFEVYAGDAAKFTVWRLDSKTDKKGITTYSLKSLLSVKLKAGDDAKTLNTLSLAKGKYYFSMESTNAKKGGSADYSVSVVQFAVQAQESCALAMPEADIGLNMPDILSFGQDMDALAFAAAPAPAGLELMQENSGLLA